VTVNADVTRINQEIADLIGSVHLASPGLRDRAVDGERAGHGSPMGLVAERQSSPVAARETRLDEEGPPTHVVVPCRDADQDRDERLDRMEETMNELRQAIAGIQVQCASPSEKRRDQKIDVGVQRTSIRVKAIRTETKVDAGAKLTTIIYQYIIWFPSRI